MLKYLAPALGSLAIGGLLVGFVVLRSDESTEQPDDASQLEDASACPTPIERSAAAAEPSPVAPGWTPSLQSPDESLTQDQALAAEAEGWTPQQVEAQFRASEALDSITSRLAAERPDVFIGAALFGDPDKPPKLYIKGPADETIRDIVAAAEVQIDVVDSQPYSRAELDARQMQVVNALREMGFANFGAGSDISNRGQIEVGVTRQAGLPDDPEEIRTSLPAELRDSVTVIVSESPVACRD